MALMLVRTCGKIEGGLPSTLRLRMLFNIMLDFGIGLVPFVGDIADALYRANTRNAWLLEVYLQKKAEAEKKGHVSDPDLGIQMMPVKPEAARIQQPTRPEPVRVQSDPRGGFRYTNGKVRRPDEEMAMKALQYGVEVVRPHIDGRTGTPGVGTPGARNGLKAGRTKEDLAMAALRYGARGALDAYDNSSRSKSAGRR